MNKSKIIRVLRILSSFLIVGILTYRAILDYALWVLPPVGKTKDESIDLLESGIMDKTIGHVITGLTIIGIVIFFNWLIQSKVEKMIRRKELILITLTSIIIVALGIGIGMEETHSGLLIEIDRNFN